MGEFRYATEVRLLASQLLCCVEIVNSPSRPKTHWKPT